jgi:pyridoxine 5'-phosphate synthase PdxJ
MIRLLLLTEFGLGINAGHDLSLDNLKYFADTIPNLVRSIYWTCFGF